MGRRSCMARRLVTWSIVAACVAGAARLARAADAKGAPETSCPIEGGVEQAGYAAGRGDVTDYTQFRQGLIDEAAVAKVGLGEIQSVATQLVQASLETRGLRAAADIPVQFDEKLFILYGLVLNGIPVARNSDALAIVRKDGKALVLRSRNLPVSVDATEPTVDRRDAVSLGRAFIGTLCKEENLTVVDPSLEIRVGADRAGRLTWTFTVRCPSPVDPHAYQFWVAATGAPEILASENLVFHDHKGIVTGKVWQASPIGPKVNVPMPYVTVTRVGDGGGTATTDSAGRFSLPGTGNVQIKAGPEGTYCKVDNTAGAEIAVANTGNDTAPIDLHFDPADTDEFGLAQTTAYYWTSQVHEYVKSVLGSNLLMLPAKVNINDTCNAYWDGTSINFFKSGGGCPNTAYVDVIVHEYGHGVDARLGGIRDGGYSEGFGDAMAILMTRQPCLGRDFKGAGTCLRDARDLITWPPSSPEVHYVGRIYAGFCWELIQQLRKTLSEDLAYETAKKLILAAVAGNPASIPDAVMLSFLTDDNDGDLSNGSPHFDALAAAADSRKIPRPAMGPAARCLAANAHFGWNEKKTLNANANLLSATIKLPAEMDVHITANTSVKAQKTALDLRTGVLNEPAVNTMWTNSLRDVSLPLAGKWVNVGSTMAIRLKAGTYTIYWKVWVSGGTIEFSSGVLLVEAFELPSKTSLGAEASAETTTEATPAVEHELRTFKDPGGEDITRME